MRKILEELYHGNLSVDERTIRAGSKYARALAEVAKIEEAIYECIHGGGLHHRLSNGRADHDGSLAPGSQSPEQIAKASQDE